MATSKLTKKSVKSCTKNGSAFDGKGVRIKEEVFLWHLKYLPTYLDVFAKRWKVDRNEKSASSRSIAELIGTHLVVSLPLSIFCHFDVPQLQEYRLECF